MASACSSPSGTIQGRGSASKQCGLHLRSKACPSRSQENVGFSSRRWKSQPRCPRGIRLGQAPERQGRHAVVPEVPEHGPPVRVIPGKLGTLKRLPNQPELNKEGQPFQLVILKTGRGGSAGLAIG